MKNSDSVGTHDTKLRWPSKRCLLADLPFFQCIFLGIKLFASKPVTKPIRMDNSLRESWCSIRFLFMSR